MSELYKN